MSGERLVVVGAGMAAGHLVGALRDAGDERPITVLGDEGERPFERPGLSKEVLLGDAEADTLYVHDGEWYDTHDVDGRWAEPVVGLDLAGGSVSLESGGAVPFDDLVIATGARPRTLGVPGADLPGVHTLRRMPDTATLREAFGPGVRVVVVGAGWIGLEVAAAARKAGADVVVLEYADVPLAAALGPQMGQHFADLHRKNGVDLRTGVSVTGFTGGDRVSAVTTDAGEVPADVVVVGVGAVPNTELAEAAGLEVDNGIIVDDRLLARPHVLAIGDVASATNTALGQRLRVEHWDNAKRQGKLAAEVLRGGEAHYDWLPYFYTDQFDLGMEYVGRSAKGDQVTLRGDQEAGEFLAFWTREGVVTAGMNVNIWDVNDDLRALVGQRVDVARLADPMIALGDLRP